MTKASRQKLVESFQEYDEASNKASDYLWKAIEAKQQGNLPLARYIETKVLPKLNKKSYQLACTFSGVVKNCLEN